MLGIIVLAICWGRRRDKLQNESTGEKNMKNDNTLVDLESGLSKSQYKGSVHPLKKSVKNFDAYQGDMVHGYDKKLSSSKINAEYYNEFINKIDAKNCYSHERNRKFEFDERLSSSRHKLLHTEKSKELPLDKETNETNSRVPYPEYESEERSSSSEDEVFHTRQSKKANFPKGARRTPKI